jgi:antitoxin (DNA-binding transcriptional repressor) of toxin-antitoxin stability system
MKSNVVGLKELRENIETYISRVKKGASFLVIRKSRPVFKITPPEMEERWETVVDFTTINKDGVSAKKVLRELRELNAKSQKASF